MHAGFCCNLFVGRLDNVVAAFLLPTCQGLDLSWKPKEGQDSGCLAPPYSPFFQSDATKFHFLDSCLARCPKWRVSKNHIVRASTSGSWTPNWFSSKMISTSSFVIATVALSMFPLPCFLSFRRLHFRTSLDTLNSSSFRMLTLALFWSGNGWILHEKEDIASGSHFEFSFFFAIIWKLHSSLSSSSGGGGDFNYLSFFATLI